MKPNAVGPVLSCSWELCSDEVWHVQERLNQGILTKIEKIPNVDGYPQFSLKNEKELTPDRFV